MSKSPSAARGRFAENRLVVRRLTGPGARAAASAWAAERATRSSVDLEGLPVDGDRIWLDDAPGARTVADIWVFWALCRQLDVELVLTGRARDGGHPMVGESFAMDGGGASSVGPSCAVVVPPETPGEVFGSNSMRALARLEATSTPHWLELRRLRMVGREVEVEQRARELLETPGEHGWSFYQLAGAYAFLGRRREALSLARRVHSTTSDARLRADGGFMISKLVREEGVAAELVRPASDGELFKYHLLRGTLADLPSSSPILARSRSDLQSTVRRADLHLAVRRVEADARARIVKVYASVFEPEARRVEILLDALNRGAGAEEVMALLPQLDRLRAMDRTGYDLVRGRVAAHLDERDLVRRLGWTCRKSIQHYRDALENLLPRVDAGTPVWSTATWLRTLWECEEHRERVLQRLSELPARPLAAGDYLLLHPVGRGGSAVVWKAEHVPTKRPVAVKILRRDTSMPASSFQQELECAASLDHPNITSVWDWLHVDEVAACPSRGELEVGQLLIVTEYIDGGSLSKWVGELDWASCHNVLYGLLDALAYVHTHGLVHRDVKPANVLLDPDGGLRLTDFGLAAADSGRVAGTPAYMAPEQWEARLVGPVTDLYALGCTAHELVTGMPPFLGGVDALRNAHLVAARPRLGAAHPVPRGLEAWIHRCMAIDPSERFHSASEAADALLALPPPPTKETRRAPAAGPEVVPETLVFDVSIDQPGTLHLGHPLPEPARTREVFQRQGSWRRGLPTDRLLDAGDPIPCWQADAEDTAWKALQQVVDDRRPHRLAVVGPTGVGRRLLLRQLTRRARLAGIDVVTVPIHGRVCVLDAEPDVAPLENDPWLIATRDVRKARPPHGTLALRDLSPLHCQWIVASRIAVTPRFAARASMEALGNPGQALELVREWCVAPGTKLVDGLLDLAGGVLSSPGPRRPKDGMDEVAGVLAVQRHARTRHELEDILQRPVDPDLLGRLAICANEVWMMPSGLRARQERALSGATKRRLHSMLADRAADRLTRSHHRLCATQLAEEAERVAIDWLHHDASMLLDATSMDALDARCPRLLMRDPLLRHIVRSTYTPVEDWASPAAMRVPERAWSLAVLLRRGRSLGGAWREAVLPTLLDRHVDSTLRAQMVTSIVSHRAHAELAEPALLEIVRPSLDLDADDAHLFTSLAPTEEADPTFRDVGRERAYWSHRAHHAAVAGDFVEALRCSERSIGLPRSSVVCNRVLALLGVGRLEDAGREARACAPVLTLMPVSVGAWPAVAATALLAEIDSPHAIWDFTVANAPAVVDPQFRSLLTGIARSLPPSGRRSAFLRLVDGEAPAAQK